MAAPPSLNRRTAIYAGIAAGVLSTAAQLLLWWIYGYGLPEILYRDARLAAAIVLGRGVLPPPATFDWIIMAVATLVHFTLSAAYGLILARLVPRRGVLLALLTGGCYGLALFGINMYGFTLFFPWFSAARDGITLTAHILFGAAAAVYMTLRSRP